MNMYKYFFFIIFTLRATTLCAQEMPDKADADRQVCRDLLAEREPLNWHSKFVWKEEMLKDTYERNVFRVMGEAFQIKSLRSDFYVKQENGKWHPIYDSRYPVESMVNLLLAHVQKNNHLIELRHHQYGNHIAMMTIPLQRIHDLYGPNMEMYCRVDIADNNKLNAWLVFYQRQRQFIHLLELRTPVKSLFESGGTLQGDFYANIPQGNIKNIFDINTNLTNKTKEK